MDDLTIVTDLDAPTVAALIGLIIPALVALLTKWNVDSRIRTLVALLLSAIASAASTLIAVDGGFDWKTFLLSTLTAFLTSIVAYLGVYKPQGYAAALALATQGFGLGTTRAEPVEAPVAADGAYDISTVPAEDVPGDPQDDDSEPQPDVPDVETTATEYNPTHTQPRLDDQ